MDIARLFSFSGRISRRSFWLSSLVILGLSLGLALVALVLGSVNEVLGVAAYWVATIPMTWVGLATSVKRWHDRGKSGKWVLISFVPIIGGIWAFVETGFLAGEPGVNAYGAPESGSPFTGEAVVYQPA